MGIVLILIGLTFLLLTTITAVVIGIIGVFSYVVVYSMWSKRQHVSNTIVGSVSGAVPPLIGWAAVDPNLRYHGLDVIFDYVCLAASSFLCISDEKVEEYRAAGIPMLPVVNGLHEQKFISIYGFLRFCRFRFL